MMNQYNALGYSIKRKIIRQFFETFLNFFRPRKISDGLFSAVVLAIGTAVG